MVTRSPSDAVFKALADETRRAILDALRPGPLSVKEIAERFPVSRPAVSRHLKVLSDAGLLTMQPAGKEHLYALDTRALAPLERWLTSFWSNRLQVLKSLSERKN